MDEDGQAGQAVGVEVAEDEDPLAAGPGPTGQARERRLGVGQQPRIVEAVDRLVEPGARVGGIRRRRGATSSPAIRADRPVPRRAAMSAAGRWRTRLWERPAVARFDHAVRMPRGLHRGLPAGCVGRTSGRGAAGARRRASVGQAAVPSVVPQLPVDEQRAGDEDRRVGPRDDADEQGEDEVADRLATEQEQRERA